MIIKRKNLNNIMMFIIIVMLSLPIELPINLIVETINISDLALIFIFLFFIVNLNDSNYMVPKNKNIFIILFGLWIVILLSRGVFYSFIFEEAELGNNLINKNLRWFIQSRNIGSNFFRNGNVVVNTFFYIRYIIALLIFYLGYYIGFNNDSFWENIKLSLLVVLSINLLFSLKQLFLTQRIEGLFSNPQDLSSLALLYIAIALDFKDNFIDKFGIFLSLSIIYFTGTRSAFLALLFLLLNLLIINKKIIPIISIISINFITILISMFPKIGDYILILVKLITDNYSLRIRFDLWSQIFAQISINNPIFGANTFPTFTDNISLWIVISMGYVGLILFVMLFIKEVLFTYRKLDLKQSNLIIILFIQGLLFPGFLGVNFISLWFLIYGISKADSLKFKLWRT